MLQKYIAQYSSGSTVRHVDLRFDKRIVFNSFVGRRNDCCSRRGGRKYNTTIAF